MTSAAITYRQLSFADREAYLTLRREAVAQEPQAFSDSPAEVESMPEAVMRHRLEQGYMIGAFAAEKLIGKAGYYIHNEVKYRHRGYLHGVFLAQDWRGRRDAEGVKIAEAMLRRLIDHARHHVEHLELSVEEHSAGAQKLYEGLGFQHFGRLPKMMKLEDGRYITDLYMWLDLTQQPPQSEAIPA